VKRLLAAVVGLALALVGTMAVAAWLSTGSAEATATATTVSQANQPTAVRGAGQVTLSWAASTLASGDPVGGYRVVRHDGATTTTVCTVSGLACADSAPVATTVTYGVIATVGTHWEGPESATTSFTYDDVAPVTTAQVSPAPNSAAWNNSSVTVTLHATDTGNPAAGVDHVHYVLDSGTPVDVNGATASVLVTGTGTHTLTYGAVDKAGNTESTHTQTVKIDPDLPLVTNLQPTSAAAGTWAAMKCASGDGICADASDALSGVAIDGVTYSLTATSGTNSGKCWNGTSFATAPCAQQPMSLVSGTRYAGSTGLTAANLAAGSYTLVVKATDVADNVSSASSTFTVKADQTITFTSPAPSGATVGGATYTVTATATSGQPVTFTSATTSVCTVSGSTVSFVGTGTCTINADQAGNAGYNPAPQVQQSFAVRANQTITFNALSDRTYGDASFTVSATASSGLTVTFSSATSAVCTVSGNTVTLVAAGGCTINADQAGDSTYNAAAQVQRSFTVAKANQTIHFGSSAPTTRAAGTTYTPSATATSGLPVTITVTGACSISSGTVTFGPSAGTCTINANQVGDGNYNPATQVQQTVSVTAAADTTAPSVSIIDIINGDTFATGNSGTGSWAKVCGSGMVCATITDNVTSNASIAATFTLVRTDTNQCWNGSSFVAGSACSVAMSYNAGQSRFESNAISRATMGANHSFTLTVRGTDAASNTGSQVRTFATN
jgi:hypothetical protein